MASENETPVKKGKPSQWDNINVFRELAVVFYDRLDAGGGLNPEFKEAVAAYLQGCGHDVSWNALRYAFSLFSLLFKLPFFHISILSFSDHVLFAIQWPFLSHCWPHFHISSIIHSQDPSTVLVSQN